MPTSAAARARGLTTIQATSLVGKAPRAPGWSQYDVTNSVEAQA